MIVIDKIAVSETSGMFCWRFLTAFCSIGELFLLSGHIGKCVIMVVVVTENFSKIILGTVQLGSPYGLGDWKDKVMPESVAFRILDEAWASGINTLDTASSYGLAEDRIAKFLRQNPQKYFHIISKFKDMGEGSQSALRLDQFVKGSGFVHLPNCSSYHLLFHD